MSDKAVYLITDIVEGSDLNAIVAVEVIDDYQGNRFKLLKKYTNGFINKSELELTPFSMLEKLPIITFSVKLYKSTVRRNIRKFSLNEYKSFIDSEYHKRLDIIKEFVN